MKWEKHINYNTDRKPRGKCGKVSFDKKTAQTKKNMLERIGKVKELRIYPCNVCKGKWHLTKRLY